MKVRNCMKRDAKITSKGQITIPRAIRDVLGVQTGDRVRFEQHEDGVLVKPLRTSSPFDKYCGIGHPGIPRGRKGINKWLREMRGE